MSNKRTEDVVFSREACQVLVEARKVTQKEGQRAMDSCHLAQALLGLSGSCDKENGLIKESLGRIAGMKRIGSHPEFSQTDIYTHWLKRVVQEAKIAMQHGGRNEVGINDLVNAMVYIEG